MMLVWTEQDGNGDVSDTCSLYAPSPITAPHASIEEMCNMRGREAWKLKTISR